MTKPDFLHFVLRFSALEMMEWALICFVITLHTESSCKLKGDDFHVFFFFFCENAGRASVSSRTSRISPPCLPHCLKLKSLVVLHFINCSVRPWSAVTEHTGEKVSLSHCFLFPCACSRGPLFKIWLLIQLEGIPIFLGENSSFWICL